MLTTMMLVCIIILSFQKYHDASSMLVIFFLIHFYIKFHITNDLGYFFQFYG